MPQQTAIPKLEQSPKEIRASSTNFDVQIFLFNELLKYNDNLTRREAWDKVKNAKGNGEGISLLEKAQWTKIFGDTEGSTLYHKIEKEKRNAEKGILTDISKCYTVNFHIRCGNSQRNDSLQADTHRDKDV